MRNPNLPVEGFDLAFVRYTINSETLPSYFNGIKSEIGKIQVTIPVELINSCKIKVSAVVCRAGWADSEIVVQTYNKINEERPKKADWADRGGEAGNA